MVVSDTHGNYLAPLSLLDGTGAGLLVHLGDEIDDARALEPLLDIPLLKVPGNCDPGATEPREIIGKIAGKRILMTHGDRYKVKNGLEHLISKATEQKVAVVLFGHTHIPCVQKHNGILLVNPGTLMTTSDTKSYAIVTVTVDTVKAEIIHLP